MTWFEDLFLTQGIGWAAALGDVAVRSTVLLAVAGTLALLLRKRAATVRHRVWILAFAGVLSLPVVGVIVPGLPLAVPMPRLMAPSVGHVPATGSVSHESDGQTRSEVGRPLSARPPVVTQGGDTFILVETGSNRATLGFRAPSVITPGETTVASLDIAHAVAGPDLKDHETSRSAMWPRWVLGVWAIGAAVLLGRLLIGRFMRRRLGRAARPVTDPERLSMFDQIVAELGIRRRVRLLESHRVSVPITWGCWQAVVAVPATSETWSEGRWRVVLLHELTHVRRGDCLSQLVSQLACVVHWFNPLAWFGAKSLRLEGERACDEGVIRAGTRASDYAEHLLEIAQACQPRDWTASATVGMARLTQLEGRLLNILAPTRSPAASRRLRYAASALVVATILGVAAVQPAATTDSGQTAQPHDRVLANVVPVLSLTQVDEARAARPAPLDGKAAYAIDMAASQADVAEITEPRSSRERGDLAATIDQLARPAPPQQTPNVSTSSLTEKLEAAQEAMERAQERWQVSLEGQDWDVFDRYLDLAVDYDLDFDFDLDFGDQGDGSFGWQSGDVSFGAHGDPTPLDDRVASALMDALDDSQADVRRSAVVALGRNRVERAVEPLAAVLSDADAGIRAEAARALGRIRREEAVPGLVGALNDAEPEVAGQAAIALGRIRSETAAPGLSAALDHDDDDVREQIVRALGRIRSAGAVDGLVIALRDEESAVRAAAARALGSIRDASAVDGLIVSLDDAEQRVVRYAIRALARIDDERAVDALVGAVGHDNPDVRRAAIVALSGSGNWTDQCWDGGDNDGDGLIDGGDPDCR